MKFHRFAQTIPLFIAAFTLGAGCDEVQSFDEASPNRADALRLAEDALDALEVEDVYRPEFWAEGAKLGGVNLGSWACVPPPPPPGCTKTKTGWLCEPQE